jgi:rsbT co-antagonist protein RsbR
MIGAPCRLLDIANPASRNRQGDSSRGDDDVSETMNVEVLTQVLRRIPGAVWSARISLVTGKMEWVYVDAKTAELHDMTEAELRADPGSTTQRVLPEDRDKVNALLTESLQTLAPVVWSGRVQCRSGELRWIESHMTFLRESEQSLLMFGQVFEATERKRLEQALADSEAAKTVLINRLKYSIDELSNPILEVWDDVLVMPIIGVVDSRRTADMVQRLLAEVARSQASFVIIDLTGVEIVDTKTADHLIKLMRKVEVVGARCVLTGIRAAVAETLVDIGVDFGRITTLRNLKHGLREALLSARRERGDAESDRGLDQPRQDDSSPQRRAR